MNLLHLSDIHFGRDKDPRFEKEDFKNKEKILDDLIQAMNAISPEDKPDHILVTGDIAWKGKKQEFDEALDWFRKLLDAMNLSGKDISICVGNHDINRDAYVKCDELNEYDIGTIDELYTYENTHRFEPLIFHYNEFCEQLGIVPYSYIDNGSLEYSYSIGYKDIVRKNNEKLRIVSFNTSMLSRIKCIKSDKMWLGLNQIKTLIDYGVIPEDSSYTIALFHHAERFLSPNETCEYDGRLASLPLLRKKVDLCLCGHTETGGIPVLMTQEGGGKLLTAGATYYSDSHPNSFSILKTSDKSLDKVISYQYTDSWIKLVQTEKDYQPKKVKQMELVNDNLENCYFISEFPNGKRVSVLLKRLSVYRYQHNGEPFIRIDNKKEVNRILDFRYDGPVRGGSSNTNFSLAKTKENSVEALLSREKYFRFLADNSKLCDTYNIFITQGDSTILLMCPNGKLGIKETDIPSDLQIDALEKIIRIEEYFDITLAPPYEIFENDYRSLNLMIELIDNGHISCTSMGSELTSPVDDYDSLQKLYQSAQKDNSFYFQYSKGYKCKLFSNEFRIGKLYAVSDSYSVDIEDLKKKIDSFEPGDVRVVRFSRNNDTPFKVSLYPIQLAMDEIKVIHIGEFDLHFDFLIPER